MGTPVVDETLTPGSAETILIPATSEPDIVLNWASTIPFIKGVYAPVRIVGSSATDRFLIALKYPFLPSLFNKIPISAMVTEAKFG